MRNSWILKNVDDIWESFHWDSEGHNWFMCEEGVVSFFPRLKNKTKARLKITKTRHEHSIKLCLRSSLFSNCNEMTIYSPSWPARTQHLTCSPTGKLKHIFPELNEKGKILTVYVSLTPMN